MPAERAGALYRRGEMDTVLERVAQHCTADCGGSFLSGSVRARLFACTISSFGHESWTPPPGPEDEGELDKLLRSTAHRMVRRQFSLDAKWFEQTKAAFACALSLPADEEGQLAVEAALSEAFLVISLSACVFTCYVALEGPAAATARCTRKLVKTPGPAAHPFVSAQHWERLRKLSPKAMTPPGTPLLRPFGPGDNAQTGGNRMHSLLQGVKGDLLPPSVQAFLECASSMGGVKGTPMRSCTLVPGDMEAFLQAMTTLYVPPHKFMSFAKLPGRELSRSELECVADATAATVACSF